MSESIDRLYKLLPAVYRARDITVGSEALRALLGVAENEFQTILDDIDRLYNDWFIETCSDWVVPYLGDLLGVRELNEIPNGAFSRRAYVANTFAYRRRKGTPAVVEQLARDVTGWPAHVVEYFKLLALTQNYNHLRPGNQRLDIRNASRLELLGSPFEDAAYSAELRRIAIGRGRYNIPSVGLFLWRLAAYPIVRADARAADDVVGDGFYRFSQLGHDMCLFNRPETETSITQLAREINVPGPLRRRPLYEELKARKAAVDANETPSMEYFDEQPVFEIYVDDETEPVPFERIMICDLSEWRRPVEDPPMISVDPVLGRIAFQSDDLPQSVRVSYAYGFSADIGGGAYNRRASLAVRESDTYYRTVSKTPGAADHATIQAAVQAWQTGAGLPPSSYPDGIIEILDSATYDEEISIAFDQPDPDDGRSLVIQARDGERPHLRLSTQGLSVVATNHHSSLTLNGLLIEGLGIIVESSIVEGEVQALGELNIAHCTLVPGAGLNPDGSPTDSGAPSIATTGAQEGLQVSIVSSIVGRIEIDENARSLTVADSILDGHGGACMGSPAGEAGPPTTIERSTVFGYFGTRELTYASECIFADLDPDDRVHSNRRQSGCVRFSYVPPRSRTPRRYFCQAETAEAVATAGGAVDAANTASLVRPEFTTTRYGTPGYAQLTITTPTEIRMGAEDGSEMGAFSQLKQPQREGNLRIGLEEYMRLGLDTGVFFVT